MELAKTLSVSLPNTLTDHPSLIGLIRLPSRDNNYYSMDIPVIVKEGNTFKNVVQPVLMCSNIKGYNGQFSQTSKSYTVPKGSITDFYPYTYYVLTDGECDPLILHPQHMPSSVQITGISALSHQPVERYFIKGYKGDNDGRVYNITNLNQMMLPTATNEGIGYMSANANTIMQNRKSAVTSNILNAVGGVVSTVGATMTGVGLGALAGANAIKSGITGINEIKNSDARHKDQTMTPNSISSFGTPSTRDAFNNNKVSLYKYTIQEKYKNKINNFVERFGNKFNNYDTIDLKTYKGYIKMLMPDIDGKIDNMYINKIISILERGIYIE